MLIILTPYISSVFTALFAPKQYAAGFSDVVSSLFGFSLVYYLSGSLKLIPFKNKKAFGKFVAFYGAELLPLLVILFSPPVSGGLLVNKPSHLAGYGWGVLYAFLSIIRSEQS